jgi:hypothetical protein
VPSQLVLGKRRRGVRGLKLDGAQAVALVLGGCVDLRLQTRGNLRGALSACWC